MLWQTEPPIRIKRLSREDQYLDEGLWHVRRRNSAEVDEAWHENLILERFFVPVLDLPTYASPNGNRWPPEQRANIAKQVVTRRALHQHCRVVSDRRVAKTGLLVDRRASGVGVRDRADEARPAAVTKMSVDRYCCLLICAPSSSAAQLFVSDRWRSDRRARRSRRATGRERHRGSRSCSSRSSRDWRPRYGRSRCKSGSAALVDARSRRSSRAAADPRRSSRRHLPVHLLRSHPRKS